MNFPSKKELAKHTAIHKTPALMTSSSKTLGATLLVAGTCIGSGTLALPLSLAKVGLVPGLLVMLLTWALSYYTAFLGLELNSQAGCAASIGPLARRFSGPIAAWIGSASVLLLSFALMAAYLHGTASVTQKLLQHSAENSWASGVLILGYTAFAACIFLFPIAWIDRINRLLFWALIFVFCILISFLLSAINFLELPLWGPCLGSFSAWTALIPIVFTSFGFQVIFHTLTHYCNNKINKLRRVFFWGSLIPAIVYMLWISGCLGVLASNQPAFYARMASQDVGVGDLVQALSSCTHRPALQGLTWGFTLLAILTSIIGLGLGLIESLQAAFQKHLKGAALCRSLAIALALLPSAFIAIKVPNAFMCFFSFAGMTLAVISILLPLYLLKNTKKRPFYYRELRPFLPRFLALLGGVVVIVCEVARVLG